MTKLKVTEVEKVVDVKKDEVVAGQVRKSRNGDNVVLIVDARGTVATGSSEEPFVAVILQSVREGIVNKIDQIFHADSEEKILSLFPTLLDAELTYSEAK